MSNFAITKFFSRKLLRFAHTLGGRRLEEPVMAPRYVSLVALLHRTGYGTLLVNC